MDTANLDLSFEVVTPLKASKYLEMNFDGNRSIRKSATVRYSETMKKNQWRDFATMLVFDSTGKLIDGQHRLSAQIDAGKTIGYVVLRGLDQDDYSVIDSGVRRSISDRSDMTKRESTIASAMAQYDVGAPIKKCLSSISSGGKIFVTEADLIAYADANLDEIKNLAKMYSRARHCVGKLSTVAFATAYMVIKNKYNEDTFEKFAGELATWNTQCPQALAAQKSLSTNANGNANQSGKRERDRLAQTAIIIRACDQYVAGFIPNMPTKALVTESNLKEWRKVVA